MSIIQKLENSYVAILRVVVIVVATILLVIAAGMGVMALKGMLPASQEKIEVGAVDPKEVLAQVAPDPKQAAPEAGQAPQGQDQAKPNPYLADYEKSYTAVSGFVVNTSKHSLEIDKTRFFHLLDQTLAEYDDADIKGKYAAGLAAAFGASLTDKRLIARVEKPVAAQARPVAAPVPAQVDADGNLIEEPAVAPAPVADTEPYKESPLVIVNEVMSAYTKMFNKKLADAQEKQSAAVLAQVQAKEGAAMRMYVAGGVFGTFLLVIFLTVAIRIERNLRDIALRT